MANNKNDRKKTMVRVICLALVVVMVLSVVAGAILSQVF